MKRVAVFDISIFIWDKNHFEDNKTEYFELVQVVLNIFEHIQENKVPVALRAQLIEEIFAYFPYADVATNGFNDFQSATLLFLTNIVNTSIQYPDEDIEEINCDPELCKTFFEISTQAEIRYLITYLYKDKSDEQKFLSFSILYNSDGDLKLRNGDLIEVKTYLCDDISEHEKIISRFKNIFEHNPKHDAYKAGGAVSKLSCYNDREGDAAQAQKLLDKAVSYNEGYFNYDDQHDTFVKFVLTGGNVYHGYDVQLTEHEQAKIREMLDHGE